MHYLVNYRTIYLTGKIVSIQFMINSLISVLGCSVYSAVYCLTIVVGLIHDARCKTQKWPQASWEVKIYTYRALVVLRLNSRDNVFGWNYDIRTVYEQL